MESLEQNLFDYESERRVIASMLNNVEACTEAHGTLKPEDFYSPFNAAVFGLVTNLYERDITPSYVELLKEGSLLGIFNDDNFDSLQYIVEHVIDDENIGFWIKNVKNKSKLRKLDKFILLVQDQLGQPNANAEELLIKAEGELTALTAFEYDAQVDSPQELAHLGYSEVERRFLRYKDIMELHNGVIPLDGITTGFESLNKLTLGFKPGDLIILGAQTGHGKTSFALHVANAVAVKSKRNVLYLNTEMSRQQIALRWGSILSGVEHERVRSGEISPAELSKLLNAYSQLRESGFYSYPCPNLTKDVINSITRKFRVQKEIDLMIVDYIGRMDKVDPKLSEWQILEQIVKEQKLLAQNLGIAVMCLVQLNPDGSLQGAKRMKNECDLMLKLSPVSREDLEENEELKKYDVMPNYYISIDKNRDGQSGVRIPIFFDLQRQIMRDVNRVSS
jgi:replicative DNA helicase